MSPESRHCVHTFCAVPYAAVINVSKSHRERRAGIRERECVDLTNEVILTPVNTPASFDAGKVECQSFPWLLCAYFHWRHFLKVNVLLLLLKLADTGQRPQFLPGIGKTWSCPQGALCFVGDKQVDRDGNMAVREGEQGKHTLTWAGLGHGKGGCLEEES